VCRAKANNSHRAATHRSLKRRVHNGPGDQAQGPQRMDMEKIVSLCKRRGFLFQSSEIYG
jgi:hypothetical protein